MSIFSLNKGETFPSFTRAGMLFKLPSYTWSANDTVLSVYNNTLSAAIPLNEGGSWKELIKDKIFNLCNNDLASVENYNDSSLGNCIKNPAKSDADSDLAIMPCGSTGNTLDYTKDMNSMAFSFWIKKTTANDGAKNSVFRINNTTDDTAIDIVFETTSGSNTTKLNFTFNTHSTGDSPTTMFTWSGSMSLDTWYNVFVYIDNTGDGYKLYLNGSDYTSSNDYALGAFPNTTNNNLLVLGNANTQPTSQESYLSNLYIWKNISFTDTSAMESVITALYNSGTPASCSLDS